MVSFCACNPRKPSATRVSHILKPGDFSNVQKQQTRRRPRDTNSLQAAFEAVVQVLPSTASTTEWPELGGNATGLQVPRADIGFSYREVVLSDPHLSAQATAQRHGAGSPIRTSDNVLQDHRSRPRKLPRPAGNVQAKPDSESKYWPRKDRKHARTYSGFEIQVTNGDLQIADVGIEMKAKAQCAAVTARQQNSAVYSRAQSRFVAR